MSPARSLLRRFLDGRSQNVPKADLKPHLFSSKLFQRSHIASHCPDSAKLPQASKSRLAEHSHEIMELAHPRRPQAGPPATESCAKRGQEVTASQKHDGLSRVPLSICTVFAQCAPSWRWLALPTSEHTTCTNLRSASGWPVSSLIDPETTRNVPHYNERIDPCEISQAYDSLCALGGEAQPKEATL